MLSRNIDTLTLPELCELLVTNTTELLVLMNKKNTDGLLLFDKKKDVELIQSTIVKRRSMSPPPTPITRLTHK
jgi:hypothetical protein